MAKKRRFAGILAGIFVVLIAGGIGVLSWWSWGSKPYASSGNAEMIAITPGTTVAQLAEELERRHLIRSASAFKLQVRAQQAELKLYVGDYLLSPTMAPEDMIKRLLKGPESTAIRVTIPEGYTTEQIIALLVDKGLGSKEDFTKVVTNDAFAYPFLKDTPKGIHRLEGYLFPDTYFFEKKTSPHAVIDVLLQRFAKELTPDTQKQLDAMKFSVQQWVALGSLVEKEAQKESDRPLIASVFLNRLKINQPLQSCASIQFLLGTPKPKLYDKDLQIPSPYNTYLHTGLPPGPIANPGHASLQAALHPAQTDYYYFVAKNDGYHAFAKTFEEHLKNQQMYQ